MTKTYMKFNLTLNELNRAIQLQRQELTYCENDVVTAQNRLEDLELERDELLKILDQIGKGSTRILGDLSGE